MFGLTISELFVIILGLITIAQFIFKLVQGVRDPNVKQDSRLQKMEVSCQYKHQTLDQELSRMSNALLLIQENDLKHIETRMTNVEKGILRVETMLDERLPRKQVM